MATRLTKPQLRLLFSLPAPVWGEYKPALKLIEMGLAEWDQSKRAWGYTKLVRTAEGEKRLKECRCPDE